MLFIAVHVLNDNINNKKVQNNMKLRNVQKLVKRKGAAWCNFSAICHLQGQPPGTWKLKFLASNRVLICDLSYRVNTMKYYSVQCHTIQYHTIQCNDMQYNEITYITIRCNTIRYHTMHFLIIIRKVLILILSIFIGLCIFQSVQAQTVLIQSLPDLRVFKRCTFILERPSLKFTRRTKQCLF